jgi:uncharacterized membrane protein YphA (DoxX/SURF4 family)
MPHRVTAETLRIIEVCGRVFVAIAMVGFGIQQFLYKGFLAGVELLPERIPGHTIWADLAGAVLIVCGVLIAINKRSRLSAIILANLFFLSELFRRLPGIGAIVQDLSKRTVVFETLSLGAGCLILAAMLPESESQTPAAHPGPSSNSIAASKTAAIVGRIFLVVSLAVFGWTHLLIPKFIAFLIPAWMPARLFLAYFTAVAFIAAAIAIAIKRLIVSASTLLGVMFFLWVVTLHAPRVAAALHNPDEWNSLFMCLAMSGICFVLAASFNPARQESPAAEDLKSAQSLAPRLLRPVPAEAFPMFANRPQVARASQIGDKKRDSA